MKTSTKLRPRKSSLDPAYSEPAMNARVNQLREEIANRTGVSYGFGKSSIPGTCLIEARHSEFPMPIAIVWYTFAGRNTIMTLNSFVDEHYRRCGLRSYLHERLLACYPTVECVISAAGTDSGAAWMKATGYKQTARGWEYHRHAHGSDGS